MKHVAIISPGILPVPATRGGAVESLLTFLIEENEKVEGVKFDLFSLDDGENDDKRFHNSTIYRVKKAPLVSFADRVADKIYRTLPGNISAKRFYDYSIVSKVKDVLTTGKFSYDAIIVENQMSLALKVIESGLAKDTPIFFHMHNDVDIYRSPYYCRKLADYKVSFICVSEYIKSRVLEYAPNADVRVLYNGTDTEIFDYELSKNRNAVRAELGIESEETVFLYSGRIIRQKGVLELIDGYKFFLDHYPEFNSKLLIVGMGDIPTKYESHVIERCNDIGDNIICHKKVDAKKMAQIVACSDAVMIPTIDEEPFGMVAIEAMAMGKPVIATRSGALSELLTADNAILVSKGDRLTEELSDGFVTLMDGNKRGNMGDCSRQLFLRRGDWHKGSFYRNFCAQLGIIYEC